MKICFVCNEYPPGPHGGLGSLAQTLSRGLADAGHSIRVIGVYKRGYPAPDYEDDMGAQIWRMRESSIPKIGWLVDRMRLYWQVRQWSAKREIDLVEVSDYHGWAAGWGRLGVPVVARLNGSSCVLAKNFSKPIHPLVYFLEKASLNRADFGVSATRAIARQTAEVFNQKKEIDSVIYNPVPVFQGVCPWEERLPRKVVFVGTVSETKGILSLLAAWPIVRSVFPDAELDVYGKFGKLSNGEPIETYLAAKMDDWQSIGVRFRGFTPRDEVLTAFRQASVAVFPSFFESFGLVAAEAMSFGCPTIFTKLASGPELIEDGVSGLLIDPADPKSISEAILRVLQDRSFAESIGARGKAQVENRFALEAVLALNVAFYTRCIEQFPDKR